MERWLSRVAQRQRDGSALRQRRRLGRLAALARKWSGPEMARRLVALYGRVAGY